MRTFETGATRDKEDGKHDYEGYLSPTVLRRFGEYMTKHRVQADGNVRASDNWQKGIPLEAYMKSLWRHVVALWLMHRGNTADEDVEEALCAIIFNAQGYLHEHLKKARVMAENPTGTGEIAAPLPSRLLDSAILGKKGPWYEMLSPEELTALEEETSSDLIKRMVRRARGVSR